MTRNRPQRPALPDTLPTSRSLHQCYECATLIPTTQTCCERHR